MLVLCLTSRAVQQTVSIVDESRNMLAVMTPSILKDHLPRQLAQIVHLEHI